MSANAENTKAPDGRDITVNANSTFSCTENGTISSDYNVTATHQDVSEYKAVCTVSASGIKCLVE